MSHRLTEARPGREHVLFLVVVVDFNHVRLLRHFLPLKDAFQEDHLEDCTNKWSFIVGSGKQKQEMEVLAGVSGLIV